MVQGKQLVHSEWVRIITFELSDLYDLDFAWWISLTLSRSISWSKTTNELSNYGMADHDSVGNCKYVANSKSKIQA